MNVGDVAGEGAPPTAQRASSTSITLLKEAVDGEESRRAVDWTTPTASGAQIAPAYRSRRLSQFDLCSGKALHFIVFFGRSTARSPLSEPL